MAFRLIISLALVALSVRGQEANGDITDTGSPWTNGQRFHGVTVNRAPLLPHQARRQNTDVECTAIYTVRLNAQYTNQGNDLSMLPTHGKDTSVYRNTANFRDINSRNIGGDFTNEPFANDPEKQAKAAAQFSVTALTENIDVSFPLGFKQDVLHQYHAVCVNIIGVAGRWVEIMAQSTQSNQQICVDDWKPADPQNPIQSTCGNGELYTCRESNSAFSDSKSPIPSATATRNNNMAVKFMCKDSCDDHLFSFYWRISSSQEVPRCVQGTEENCQRWEQPDGENWCGMREGDDYPASLLNPYPADYDPPAVFQRSISSASQAGFSIALFALLAVCTFLLM